MAMPRGLEEVMNVDPDILGGDPCFNGTRVPLETVVDNLAAGTGIDELLADYPSLTREHINAVLRWEADLARDAAGLKKRAS